MDWNWSFRLVRLFRTDVRIHWTLPAFLIYFVMRGAEYGGGLLFLSLFVLLPFLLLFASVVMHEFGHVFAARHFGLPVHHVVLTPMGGMAVMGGSHFPRSEFVVAAAGPLVNLALGALAFTMYWAFGGPLHVDMLVPLSKHGFGSLWSSQQLGLLVLYDFVQMQMFLFLFNVLMVAYPMDGGRMVFSVLWARKGYRRGLSISCGIAKGMAIALGLFGLVTLSPMLLVVGVFLFIQARMTERRLPMFVEPEAPYYEALHRQRLERKQSGRLESWKKSRERAQTARALEKAERDGIHTLSAQERELLRRRREGMN
jgi:stage IV sporulation protein FB